jgi:hypothetical protein
MKAFLSIQKCPETSGLKNIDCTISDDYRSSVFGSNLVISARINFSDANQYETIGRFYIIWLFDFSQQLKIKLQYIYHTKSMDNFLYPCGIKDGELAFFINNSTHLFLENEMPFQKAFENKIMQSLQTNNGVYSLTEVGGTFNKTQILTLQKADDDSVEYVQHLGADNNIKKFIPEYKKPKETSIIDYIRMKGFDEDEKFLNIEHLVDVDDNRLLLIIFHRKYGKNPATNTNKNSPFFYLFIDKKTNGICGCLKFVKDLKPFKSINFYTLEDNPYAGENIMAFPLGDNLIYKSSNNLVFFDSNGTKQKTISLKERTHSIIRSMKLVAAKDNSFYLLDLKRGLIVKIELSEDLEIKLESLNKELKKISIRPNLIDSEYLDLENVVVKSYSEPTLQNGYSQK